MVKNRVQVRRHVNCMTLVVYVKVVVLLDCGFSLQLRLLQKMMQPVISKYFNKENAIYEQPLFQFHL